MIILLLQACLSLFNRTLALRLVTLSSIAYQKTKSIQNWNCSLCSQVKLSDIHTHESSLLDVQGYYGYYPPENQMVVVFRGITDIRNWIVDMHYKQVEWTGCDGCQVHKAFHDQFNQISFFVRNGVLELRKKYPDLKVSFTGHSLGASLTMFSAVDIKYLFNNVKHVYTFGQPRVGNSFFADFLAMSLPNFVRVVNGCDEIPHMPDQSAGGLNYRHSPQEVWGNNKSLRLCSEESGQDRDCSLSCKELSYSENSIQKYVQLISTPSVIQSISK